MSLGVLVGHFGVFVRQSYVPLADEVSPVSHDDRFPEVLNHLREAVAHHLVPLQLIARCDNEYAPQERDVIVTHCIALAGRHGIEIDDSHTLVLAEYISTFRPTLMQLDRALARLEKTTSQEVADLVKAARDVVEADGTTSPEEAHFLAKLAEDLAALHPFS